MQNQNSPLDLLPEPKSTTAGNYVVDTLGLDEGTFLFTHLSSFLSYITPHDIPVGKTKYYKSSFLVYISF